MNETEALQRSTAKFYFPQVFLVCVMVYDVSSKEAAAWAPNKLIGWTPLDTVHLSIGFNRLEVVPQEETN